MSFSYTFNKKDIAFDTWIKKLDEFIIPADPGHVQEGTWRELLISNLLREQDEDDGEGSFWSHFLTEGSIRGVSVDEQDGTVDIKLQSFASLSDQFLAARMAWEALNLGAIVEKEGYGVITAEELGAEKVTEAHAEWFGLSMGTLDMLSEGGQLPIYDFLSLKLYPEDKEKDAASLEQALIERLAPFGDAFLSTRVVLALDGIGDKTAAILQPELVTLITKDVEAVALPGSQGIVAIDVFVNALGDKVIDGGGCWVFPPASSFDESLLENLKKNVLVPGEGGKSDELSHDELAILGLAPIVGFLLVAAADGKVDKKEVEGFGNILIGLANQESHPLIAHMMKAAHHACTPETLQQLCSGDADLLEFLKEFAALVDQKYSAEEAMALKAAVFHVANHVANASGGFLGIGPKVSKDEKKALAVIAFVLGLVPEQ